MGSTPKAPAKRNPIRWAKPAARGFDAEGAREAESHPVGEARSTWVRRRRRLQGRSPQQYPTGLLGFIL